MGMVHLGSRSSDQFDIKECDKRLDRGRFSFNVSPLTGIDSTSFFLVLFDAMYAFAFLNTSLEFYWKDVHPSNTNHKSKLPSSLSLIHFSYLFSNRGFER